MRLRLDLRRGSGHLPAGEVIQGGERVGLAGQRGGDFGEAGADIGPRGAGLAAAIGVAGWVEGSLEVLPPLVQAIPNGGLGA